MAVPLHCAASAGSIPGRYVRGSAFAPLHRFAMQQAFSLPLPALTGKWRLTGEGLSEGFRIKKYNFNQGLLVAPSRPNFSHQLMRRPWVCPCFKFFLYLLICAYECY